MTWYLQQKNTSGTWYDIKDFHERHQAEAALVNWIKDHKRNPDFVRVIER